MIGLIDYDISFLNKYESPNYDLGVTYAYLKKDKNIGVRLIAFPNKENLLQYKEIYIFRNSKYIPHPSSIIENYYRLPIKEFGAGFIDKDLRPYEEETRFLNPDFTCYNNMLRFSFENPRHPKAWKIERIASSKRYQQLKLYETINGETLRKDIPTKDKFIMLHDEPIDLFSNKKKTETVLELIEKGHKISFAKQLDISLLNNTIILERIIKDKNFATLRKRLFASKINENVVWLVDYFINNNCKKTNIKVLLDKGKKANYYLETLLYMNYLNRLTGYALRMRPYSDRLALSNYPLAVCAYRFLYSKPFLMSFYEYVFYTGCMDHGVPENLIRTSEERYDYILEKYGMPPLVEKLEQWLIENPDKEEFVFIGGTSNYEKERKKSNDKGRSRFAFGERPTGISKKSSN